jgi:hypothetical protein
MCACVRSDSKRCASCSCIRPHTSASVSIRRSCIRRDVCVRVCMRVHVVYIELQHTSACVSIRQHTSACVSICVCMWSISSACFWRKYCRSCIRRDVCARVCMRMYVCIYVAPASGGTTAGAASDETDYVSIRQHTSAYVSIRQHTLLLLEVRLLELHQTRPTSACTCNPPRAAGTSTLCRRRQVRRSCRHIYAYVSIRQHASAYVSIRQHTSAYVSNRQHTSATVSMRQHTSAYVSIRQHTSAYVSNRQHTSGEPRTY